MMFLSQIRGGFGRAQWFLVVLPVPCAAMILAMTLLAMTLAMTLVTTNDPLSCRLNAIKTLATYHTSSCLAAQLALGKPIFGGRTRKQQLEYVFKCCGSPGQGRWPEGNKAPLYRHLRPVDKDGKSLHFKPRLDKV